MKFYEARACLFTSFFGGRNDEAILLRRLINCLWRCFQKESWPIDNITEGRVLPPSGSPQRCDSFSCLNQGLDCWVKKESSLSLKKKSEYKWWPKLTIVVIHINFNYLWVSCLFFLWIFYYFKNVWLVYYI